MGVWLGLQRRFVWLGPGIQDGANALTLGIGLGREQAVVTDLDEAARQDVKQEAANELFAREGGGLRATGFETNMLGVDREQAMARDADSVGVRPGA